MVSPNYQKCKLNAWYYPFLTNSSLVWPGTPGFVLPHPIPSQLLLLTLRSLLKCLSTSDFLYLSRLFPNPFPFEFPN